MLSGSGQHLGADNFAFDLFVVAVFDFGFVAVKLEMNRGADDEVGGVHGFPGVSATGVGFSLRVEEEIVSLMLVLLVLDAERLHFLEARVRFDLVGEGWEREADDRDPKDRG